MSTISERASRFVVKRQITMQLLKLEQGRPYYLRFDSKVFKAKDMKAAKGEEQKQPPMLANVTYYAQDDDEDIDGAGVPRQIIVPKVLESELHDACPDHTYVGLTFRVVKHASRSGKNYSTFELAEVEDRTLPAPTDTTVEKLHQSRKRA